MKHFILFSVFIISLALPMFALPSTNLEQGDPIPEVTVSETVATPAHNSDGAVDIEDKESWWSGSNLLAVAGVLIALILGGAQVASSYIMLRMTKHNTKMTKYLELLQNYSREIHIMKAERESLIEALKKEGATNKMIDTEFLVNSAIINNLRNATIQSLNIPRMTIKRATLEEYMNLPSIPTIKPVVFKYKRG